MDEKTPTNAEEVAFSDDREASNRIIEVTEAVPGRIPAEGSVWRLYFLEGNTPSEDAMRHQLGALGAVKVSRTGAVVAVTHDGAVDPDVISVSTRYGVPISPDARDAVVRASLTEDAFNRAVRAEVDRIIDALSQRVQEEVKNQLTDAAIGDTVDTEPDVSQVTIIENESESQ